MRTKKSGKGTNPSGAVESAGKAKSRVGRFEKHNAEGCNHRLALTYASNQPGDVPKMPNDITPETVSRADSRVQRRVQDAHKQIDIHSKTPAGPERDKKMEYELNRLRNDLKSEYYDYHTRTRPAPGWKKEGGK